MELKIPEAIVLFNKSNKEQINQKKLAERISYNGYKLATRIQYISHAINGTKDIKIELLSEFSRALEVSASFLMGETDNPYNDNECSLKLIKLIKDNRDFKAKMQGLLDNY